MNITVQEGILVELDCLERLINLSDIEPVPLLVSVLEQPPFLPVPSCCLNVSVPSEVFPTLLAPSSFKLVLLPNTKLVSSSSDDAPTLSPTSNISACPILAKEAVCELCLSCIGQGGSLITVFLC